MQMKNLIWMRHRLKIIYFIIAILSLTQCKHEQVTNKGAVYVLLSWNKLLLELVQTSEGYRPPVSGRMYAYMGMAQWEINRQFLQSAISMQSKFDELEITAWDPIYGKLIQEVALNSCYDRMIHHFFPHATMAMQKKVSDFKLSLRKQFLNEFDKFQLEQSEHYGIKIADEIFEFSKLDRVGHQAFAFNFDQDFSPAVGDGKWVSLDSMPALLPHWGRAKLFITDTAIVHVNPPIEFSNDRSSEFFAQAFELFNLSHPISEERRWIAEFWSDDFHGVTFCAVSRWISILIQFAEQNNVKKEQLYEAFLKLGLALNDVTVMVWASKYFYNMERPDTYIKRNINKNWEPLHHTPNFPAYPSGHATFGAAAGEILKSIFGNKISITDRSHEDNKEFIGTPRSFNSFDKMILENATSRLYLGVHYRMDCDEGLRLGKIIGMNAAKLNLTLL
jgi:membrane-associated phospholipid phosphatase